MTQIVRSTLSVIGFVLLIGTPISLSAQEKGPSGESVSRTYVVPPDRRLPDEHRSLTYTSKWLSVNRITSGVGSAEIVWTPPKGRDIIYAMTKVGNSEIVYIMLDDGSIFQTNSGVMLPYGGLQWDIPILKSQADPKANYQTFRSIQGDALYSLSSIAVYVSRDAATSWKPDTAGLRFGVLYNLALDTSQSVYLASSSGLWKQHPDSNIWRSVSSYPNSYATFVFADRKNRLYVGSFDQFYVSTNGGSTWVVDTTGLGGQTVTQMSDDAFGNVYAMSTNRLWRSTGGTQPWTRIDQAISSLVFDQSTSTVFNGVGSDSLLYAATVYGSYYSSDHGATWVRDSLQFPAGFFYGLVKTPAGRMMASTNLGVYAKDPTASDWSKTYPAQGYMAGGPLFLDGSGTMYTLGSRTLKSNTNSPRVNLKSADNGLTWSPDTAGLGGTGTGQNQIYYVDETGVQHYAAYGTSTPAKFYSKASGKPWSADTAGYRNNSLDNLTAFGSDKRGNLYAAMFNYATFNGSLLRRPIAGGAWLADTAGLAGVQPYWITVDRTGNVILGTTNGVYRKSGSVWSKIPSPSGLDGYNAFVVSVDSTGALIAGFSTLSGVNYAWRGVYSTRNNGASWTYLGLDSLSVKGLVSYGDTTFAYTYADGYYKLRSPGGSVSYASAVARPEVFQLDQNYPNPFNPTTQIRFLVPKRDRYSLKIFDLLGREVDLLLDQDLDAGVHEVRFDATRFSSGVYFYQLQSKSAVLTRKLVLLK